jgi:hypothetical protein
MKIDLSKVMNEVNKDLNKQDKLRKIIYNKTINGEIPTAIVNVGYGFRACSFCKPEVWEHPSGRKAFGGTLVNDDKIAIETTGKVMKEIEKFRKERKRINDKEQRYLKKMFNTYKVMKVPELKEIK